MDADDCNPTTVSGPGGSGDPVRIGPYRITKVLGRGAMGIVYLATHERTNQCVALKILPRDLALKPHRIERFLTEAKAAGMLDHPAIASVFDGGVSDGYHYFAMEVLDGGSLGDIVRRARPDRHRAFCELLADLVPEPLDGKARVKAKTAYFRDVATALEPVARALALAHAHGVLHRDIKPSNILFDRTGRARLCDFGLARIEGGVPVTSSNVNPCTPAYASPEQAFGQREDVVPASDVYSFGATVYECLTGGPPFDGVPAQELLAHIRDAQPRDPRAIDPDVPEALERIALCCLEKQTSRRYLSATELADDLGRFSIGAPVRARSVPAVVKAGRRMWPRRWKVAAKVSAALALVLVVGVITVYKLSRTRLARLAREDGIYRLSLDDFPGGMKKLEESRDLDPSEPLTYLFRGVCCLGLGIDYSSDMKRAIDNGLDPQIAGLLVPGSTVEPLVHLAPIKVDPTNALIDLFIADVLLRRSDLETAKDYFDRSCRENPSLPQAQLQKAIVLDRLGHWDAAIEAINDYLNRPIDGRRRQLGEALKDRFCGDLDGALKKLNELDSSELTPFVLFLRGTIRQEIFEQRFDEDLGLLRDAIADLQSAGGTKAENGGAAVALAAALFLRGGRTNAAEDVDDAWVRVNEVLQRNAPNADAWLIKGSIQSSRGELTTAIESFSEAKRLVPSTPWPHWNLAVIYFTIGLTERNNGHDAKAEELFSRARSEYAELFASLPRFNEKWQSRLQPFASLGCALSHTLVPWEPRSDPSASRRQRAPRDLDRAILYLEQLGDKLAVGDLCSELATYRLNRGLSNPDGKAARQDLDSAAREFQRARDRGADDLHVLGSLLLLYAKYRVQPDTPGRIESLAAKVSSVEVPGPPKADIVNASLGLAHSRPFEGPEAGYRFLERAGLTDPDSVDPCDRDGVIEVLRLSGH